jgi:hypothetical protein
MNEYKILSSGLQRRLALNSKAITLAEFHRAAFIYLGHRKDVKVINAELKEMRDNQVMDKKLLQLAHGASAEWEYCYGPLQSTTWLGGY